MCFPAEANPIKENSACGLCCVLASELFLLDILWSEISNPANNTKPTRLSISDTKITSQSCSQGKSWSVSAVLLWGRSVEGNGKNRDAGCRHVGARASAERGETRTLMWWQDMGGRKMRMSCRRNIPAKALKCDTQLEHGSAAVCFLFQSN